VGFVSDLLAYGLVDYAVDLNMQKELTGNRFVAHLLEWLHDLWKAPR
jgi:hypothetical protein